MRKALIFISFISFSTLFAQTVAINDNGTAGNANTILDVDVSTNNKGIMIPRLTTAQRVGIPGLGLADEGLLVYDEILNSFWYWDGTQWLQMLNDNTGWKTTGNTGTNAATNFVGTIDGNDFVTRTSNTEKMRVTVGGNVGIGTNAPAELLHVRSTTTSAGVVVDGEVNSQSRVAFRSTGTERSVIYRPATTFDLRIYGNALGTDIISFNTTNGNVGIGTNAPMATSRLQVTGGAITPQTGNTTASGIYFTPNAGGGGLDEAFIRHYVEAGENTKLVIANLNDPDDDISIRTGNIAGGYERMQINGNGTVYMNRGVFFDCNDCGGTANLSYDQADALGGNYGDLSIQGRVFSTNSNLHLSPPGGFKVVINSSYRAAGGATGTTGLDIEDGGIRMRKNYMYFQRYRYCNCYGAGSGTYALGNWDFCAVAQAGFKNNASSTDEDDDVQCAVYPAGAGPGEQTNYDYYYTEQFNTKRAWSMYLEALEDTNGVTCAASCMNFE
jgi:hypothetical protein